MPVSTHGKKATDNDTNAKPLSNEEVYSILNYLKLEVLSLKLACSSDEAEMQSLQMALSSPPPPLSSFQTPCSNLSAYYQFIQEPYCVADRFGQLQSN
ncbi:hypothetical protein O181_067333 [Austropuccinia psidii MF-1]|uniref:Uncharacterized protein n=1 Tax=Austropuccinia psidii MF-1 TaxID=1389203 RepID=A0A9Q3I4F0_9BASI|nr:hypothetical protein [Austropuccinia psidii MF-1]